MSKYLGNTRIDNLKGTTSITSTVNGKSASQEIYSTPSLPFTDSNIAINYPFKDNVTSDISGNAYTLTNNGSVTQADVTDSTNGITLYNAASFNGSNQYLSRNTATDTNLRNALYANGGFYTLGYTLSVWVYTNSTATTGEVFCATSSTGAVTIGSDQVYTFYLDGAGNLTFSINGPSTAAYLIGSYAISAQQWYHVVFITALHGNYLFINGDPVTVTYTTGTATTRLTQSILNNINRIYIGNRATTNYWNGYIKNVIFTSTIWTSDQVKQVYYSQLHDINTYNNSFFGFTNDGATGILRQKNSTMSVLSNGKSYIDITSTGTSQRNSTIISLANGGIQAGGVYLTDTILNEPPTMSSNIQTFTTNGMTYVYESTASSTVNGTSSAFAAFDNSTSTFFNDNTTQYTDATGVATTSGTNTIVDGVTRYGTWLQIDMGRRITVASFTMLPRNSFETTRSPNLFYMCGSNDGSTWSSIYTSTQNTITWAFATQTFTISTAHSYRYFRLVVSIVGNSGVSSGRSSLNLAQLTFTRKANVMFDGNVSIGSSITNYLTYAPSVKDGLILNLNSLTYTDSSAASTSANMNFAAIRQMTFSASNARTITNAASLYLEGAPIKAGSTTFTNTYGLYIDSASTTSATVTEAASLYIANAPTVTSATNGPFALKVATGITSIGGNSVLSPSTISGSSTPQTLSAVTGSHLVILNPSAAITLNLPSTPLSGTQFKIINISIYTVTLSTNSGSVYFDGNSSITTLSMTQYDRVHLIYHASNWYTF